LREEQQKQKCKELAMGRRERLCFDTVNNLEMYSDISALTVEEEPRRGWSDQRILCETLSRPRPSALAEEVSAEPVVTLRTTAEQRSHCSRLSLPKLAATSKSASSTKLPTVSNAEQRRSVERLSEVHQAPAILKVDLSDLDRNLSELRGRRRVQACDLSASLTPTVSSRRHPLHAKRPNSASQAMDRKPDSPELSELRQLVEELLWVSLLALRSCSDSGDGSKKISKDMTGRLNDILLSVVLPVLQPTARFVLPSDGAIARRLQKEWPALTTCLGLRKVTTCSWDAEELQRRSALVRKCRDLLLAKDFTKTLAHRLEKHDPEKSELTPTEENALTEVA